MADSGTLDNLDTGAAGALKIPGGDAILGAEFHQVGTDLVITDGKGLSVSLPQYFHAEHLPALVTDTGVRLAGDLVRTLTPPVMRAEVCQSAPESAIGQVSSVTGTVEVRHADGSTAQLAAGDPVFQGDVVQAGADGQINLTFVDGTNFMLGAGARMTLDELVYDPNGGQGNSFAATVMEGAFVFGTGQIAPSGNMNVNTPVGTIGIRGTTVAGTIRMEGSESVITLLPDPKTGHVGRVIISNGAGTQELNVGNATTKLVSFFITPTEPVVLPAADLMQFFDMLLQQFYDLHGGAPSNFEQGGGTGRQGSNDTDPTAEEALAQLGIDNFTTAAGPNDGTTTTTITGTVGFAALSPLLGYLPPAPTGFTFTTVTASGQVGESGTFGDSGSNGSDGVHQDNEQPGQQQPPPGQTVTVVTGGPDDDTLDGPGNGPLQIDGNEGNDTLTGGDFSDVLNGGPGNDSLDAGAGDDQINGGGGDDTIVGGHGQGNDKIDGGDDVDTVTYTSADQTIIVNLETGTASGDPDIGFDTLKNVENIVAGSGNDLLIGNAAANKLSGGAGDDQIGGQGGDDTIDGGEGTDTAVFSGKLADYLIQLDGDGYKVTDYRAGGDAVDTLINVERVRFADGEQAIGDVVNNAPTAPGDADLAPNNIAEDAAAGSAVGITALAVDGNAGDKVTYSLSDDAGGLFGIDAATGQVSLLGSLDFEAAQSHNITVRATDKGGLFSETTFKIDVGNIDDNPISELSDIDDRPETVGEDAEVGTEIGLQVKATDGDAATTVTYSLSDDAGGLFQIDADGVVSVKSPLDFEAAQSHQITVVATSSDGSTTSKTFTIDVTNINDNQVSAPVDSDAADNTVAENAGAGTVVGITGFATDADGSKVTYSLDDIEGPFSIDAETGVVTLNRALDFEAGDTQEVSVTATSADGSSKSTTFLVAVTDENEAPSITSDGGDATAARSVAENTTAVTTVAATDPDAGAALTFSIVGGADQDLFQIDATTGVLSFIAAPDFEAPSDADGDNVYDVKVQVSDGAFTDSQDVAVTVTEASDGGAATPVDFDLADNAVAEDAEIGDSVGITASSSDPDGDAITYSLTNDAGGLFAIDPDSGNVTVAGALDFETNDTYTITVKATSADGSSSTADFEIALTNVNEAPKITSNGGDATAAISIDENGTAVTTVTATDPDAGTTLTYSLVGGVDQELFEIDATTGALTFKAAPNFEVPADSGGNNIYDVEVQVSDGTLSNVQTLAVTVEDKNEAPVITSNGGGATASVSVTENTTAVTTVEASDPDLGAERVYSLSGADATLFEIDSNGVLSFKAAPNFETPADADGDNVYTVAVKVSDGALSDTQTISVAVGDANESPVITSNGGDAAAEISVAEKTTAVTTVAASDPDSGTTLVYSIVGGADQDLFEIDSSTGALAFRAAPNFDAPADSNGDNVYEVEVLASDGTLSDTQAISVTVGGTNEAPDIVSNGGAGSAVVGLTENTTAVTTVEATDPDAGTTITYSIIGGADGALFQIDSETGALSFVAPPNYEANGDADGNNIYVVQVQASDGALTDTQTIQVAVEDAPEAPSITSNGGGDEAGVTVTENATAVTTVTASDPDAGTTLTYSIVGGIDQEQFQIDETTGALSFREAPNFEAPGDYDGDNVYEVQVEVSDGFKSDTQTLAVTVENANEAPAITSNDGGATAAVTVAENTTAVTTVTANDPDAGATLTYSLVGGSDQGLFDIDASTGVLSFKVAPDFEAPADAGFDNIYDVQVQVSDGTLIDKQSIAVTVGNTAEGPVITSDGGGETAAIDVNENAKTVTQVTASGSNLTYSIVGGADQGLFTIDSDTGVLSFIGAPNFEAAEDDGNDNVYDVKVQVSDGEFTDTQDIAVSVKDQNEAPSAPIDTDPATNTVREDAPTGFATLVGITASSQDPDAGDRVFYTLADTYDDRFGVDQNDGRVFTRGNLDFETKSSYELTVIASDTSGLKSEQTFTVNVTDVEESSNQAPKITSSDTATVAEDSAEIMQIEVDDPDSAELSWSIVGGADQNLFELDLAGGLRFKEPAPNFEDPADADNDNIYEVQVQVSDGEGSDVQTIKVTVTDANGVGPVLVNHQVVLAPTAPSNLIGTSELLATDADTPPSEIVYLVKVPPANGTLYLGEGVVETGTTFTQQDVADGLLVYVPNGSSPVDDGFVVDVTDGEDTITNATVSVPVASNGAVVDGTVTFDSGTLIIGNNTYGRLDLFGASSFTITEKLIVGYGANGDGNLTVSGNGSAFIVGTDNDVGHQLLVGAAGGVGVVDILAGASLDVFGTGGWVSIGDDGNGVVNIDGAGSSFKVSMTSPGTTDEGISINVGGTGEGALNIKNGAEAEFSSDHSVSLNIGGQGGDVSVDNASLTMTLTGDPSGATPLIIQIGDQFGFYAMGITDGSTVSLEGAPALIAVGTGGETAGGLYLDGSTLNATEKGSILEIGSEFSSGQASVVNASALNIGVAKDGVYDVNVNFGSLYVNSSTVNSDVWVNNGHLGFGGAAIIEGSLGVFGRGSELGVDVGGVQSGEHGVLEVNSSTVIADGTIVFDVIGDGFKAASGDSFNFLNVDGALSVDLSRLSAVAYGVDQDFRFELVQDGSSLGMHVTEGGKSGNGAVFVGSTLGDEFTGTDAADAIFGGAGDDILGGGGAGPVGSADILNGGAGADQFYSTAGNIDQFENTSVDDNYQAVVNGKYSELPDPIPAIDQINNFESGTDKITFAGSYFQEVVAAFNEGANFSKIATEYDGTVAGDNSAFANKEDALILDGNNNLIYDHNGSDAGYTIVAHVDSTTGTISASDIQVNNDSF